MPPVHRPRLRRWSCAPTRFRGLLLGVLAAMAIAAPARAYVDANANKIDDRIESVHLNGWNFAFLDNDPTRRMAIGVENPGAVVYAIYVGLWS